MTTISLTSDIGHKDYMTGAIKGRLWSIDPEFRIADISHEVSPFNYNETVYFVKSSYRHFPAYSWHIVLVNVFDAVHPRCLVAYYDGHYFAAPDNGLLPMIFGGTEAQIIELPLPDKAESNLLAWAGAIGQAIRRINDGEAFHRLGPEAENVVEKHSLKPNFGEDWIEGRIIFIDRFENVVVNISRDLFDEVRRNRQFYIQFKSDEKVTRLVDHYGMVTEGDKLAFFNTGGFLEIAVNKGNAAGLFGLYPLQQAASAPFLKTRLFYHTVRIHFW